MLVSSVFVSVNRAQLVRQIEYSHEQNRTQHSQFLQALPGKPDRHFRVR